MMSRQGNLRAWGWALHPSSFTRPSVGTDGPGVNQDGDDDEDMLPESLLAAAAAKAAAAGEQQQQRRQHDLLVPMGTVRRTGQERVSLIRYNATGQLLGVMGAGKGLEVFR